jgi:integrase
MAVQEAIEANLYIAGLETTPRLIDRVKGNGRQSVGDWLDRYVKIIDERDVSKATRDGIGQRLTVVRKEWAEACITQISTRDVADFLLKWDAAGKKRMAQAMRSLLLDLFREAVAAGWIDRNPVEPTRAPRVQVTRARLTLEAYQAIHAIALRDYPAWLVRAMELALVTAQRREDIAAMGPRSIHDGKLWVEQGKTGNRVCIPLDLRLQAVNWSVGEVVQRCRDVVLSRHLVHHSAFAGRAKPGDKLRLHTITAAFAEARDKSGLTWPAGKTPPTFHEIRSLAARLYAEQGIDAQALLGHKSPDMTALYRDVRGSEWIEIRLG